MRPSSRGGAATSTCSTLPIGSWRKRVPSAAELLRVAGGEEAVVAAAVLVVLEAGVAQPRLDLGGDRLAGADDRHPAAQLALEHRAHQRVVGAAEDHGVDLGALERAAGALDAGERAVVDLAALLDQRRELGGGDGVQLGLRGLRGERRGVGAAVDRGGGGDQADPAVAWWPRRPGATRGERRRPREPCAPAPRAARAAPPRSPSCRRRRAASRRGRAGCRRARGRTRRAGRARRSP